MGDEVQEAVQAGLPGLSEEDVRVQLCLALLRCGRFNLAKQHLTGTPSLRPPKHPYCNPPCKHRLCTPPPLTPTQAPRCTS